MKLPPVPLPAALRRAVDRAPGSPGSARLRSAAIRAGRRRAWPGTTFRGRRPDDVTVRGVLRLCRPGGYPWLLLCGDAALAAWTDRLAVVRAGAPGDGTLLRYDEVTDLEHLSAGNGDLLVVHSARLGRYAVGPAGSPNQRHAANAVWLTHRTYLAAQPELDRLTTLVAAARHHAG